VVPAATRPVSFGLTVSEFSNWPLVGMLLAWLSTPNQIVCGCHQLPLLKVSCRPSAIEKPPSTLVWTTAEEPA